MLIRLNCSRCVSSRVHSVNFTSERCDNSTSLLSLSLIVQPTISSDILEQHTNTISNLIERYRTDAESQLREFDKYLGLIGKEDANDVLNFLKADPPNPFEKYRELIDYYDQFSKDVLLEFHHTVCTDLFVVRRQHIIEHISATATHLKGELVSRMIADYQQMVRA